MTLSPESLKRETERLCHGELTRDSSALYSQRLKELNERVEAIMSRATNEGHPITTAENLEANLLMDEQKRIGDMAVPWRYPRPGQVEGSEEHDLRPSEGQQRFLTKDGHEVFALSCRERLADMPQPDGRAFVPLSIGKAIIGLCSGRWDGARAERLALNEGGNASGGYLIGPAFSTEILDLARAASAVIAAGAITLPWISASDEMIVGAVETDPDFSIVGESELIPESSNTFGQRRFVAKKVACLVKMSREWAEDCVNGPAIVEQTLSKALGVELDRQALVGTPGTELNGIVGWPGIDGTAVDGPITWEAVHSGVLAVRGRNYGPNGIVLAPTINGALNILTTGDGVNASKNWLGPPPGTPPRFETTNAGAYAVIADWKTFVFGIRQDAMIEMSNAAGESFQRHQVWCKLTIRLDTNSTSRSAYHVLSGCTGAA